jgi:N-hydroxyarylamine O-acetyltransferase
VGLVGREGLGERLHIRLRPKGHVPLVLPILAFTPAHFVGRDADHQLSILEEGVRLATQTSTTKHHSEWEVEALDVDRYLARLDEHGPLPADLDTLRRLHRAHLARIPFENLDIFLGRQIPLDLDSLQAKLVDRQRGGYCFEHNLLFAALLDRLGYQVTRLAGRVRMGSTKILPRIHMLLRVEVGGGPWLADVGFGGEGLREPLPLVDGATARQDGWTYRLTRNDRNEWVLATLHSDGWFDLYDFTLEPQHHIDYVMANHYTATYPRSPFVGQIVIQRVAPDAYIALQQLELKETHPDGATRTRQLNTAEVGQQLANTFSITLTPDELARLADLIK